MSASLVGSEMCIRDRTCSSHADQRTVGRRRPHTASERPGCGRRGRGPWAVSYTHLTLPTICSV
eukprot:14649945-Alexandrium_andersonii.AAC.1